MSLDPTKVRLLCGEHLRAFHAIVLTREELPPIVHPILVALTSLGVALPTGEQISSHTVGPFVVPGDGTLTPVELLMDTAHQAEHVKQFYDGTGSRSNALPGYFAMLFLYVTNVEARIRYEAKASRASLEVMHVLGETLPTPTEFKAHFKALNNIPDSLDTFVDDMVNPMLYSVGRGIYTSSSGVRLISSLKSAGLVAP